MEYQRIIGYVHSNMARVVFIGTLLIYIFGTPGLYAQSSKGFGTTGNTSKNPHHRRDDQVHQDRRLTHWIKNDGKGVLLGNACMNEVTHSMGFEYVIQIKGQPGNRSEFGRFMHNFGAKTSIFFRNGPFWKIKLRRKRNECRRLTGDHLG